MGDQHRDGVRTAGDVEQGALGLDVISAAEGPGWRLTRETGRRQRLRPVDRGEERNRLAAVLIIHPSADIDPAFRQPAFLLGLPFETARTVVDLLYAGCFHKYPRLTVALAHCAGVLPALSGRTAASGCSEWKTMCPTHVV
ncbi:hypothetical protein ACIP2X_09090 [Streptomyces sp. NPDC089424]|uniref:hypothetical protein n=1 Tax=Streptomyces sp. NPDC089424 TaxID=3365917 RepID=UPI00381A3641